MSSTQNTASPRAPRAKHHQHSKSATQPAPNNTGHKPQRRQKGNRAHNGNPANAQNHGAGAHTPPVTNALEPAFTDSAALSGEDGAMKSGQRISKKHMPSQPSADRAFSPAAVATSSLTDTELGPSTSMGTPAKSQGAYAGPTFHASPAPSALPVPKFLSKSVPAKSRAAPPTPPPEDESDSGSSPTSSPSRAPIPVPTRQQDSPLDMLFKAHRAEKARNGNGSPASVSFSSPDHPSTNGRPHHVKQDSFNSLNTPFPFELDGDNRNSHTYPPPASPGGHRSITAPGKIPQAGNSAKHNDDSSAIHDLLNRLSLSQAQNNATSSTAPKTVGHIPSDPALRNHNPSPFYDSRSPFVRSASGPSTPNPAPHENPDFFYGNRNLSPMFNAVKSDPSKRNSGLRTEVTANSPLMLQGGFSQAPPPNVDTRELLGNLLNDPTSPRRGSAPQIQPVQQMLPAHPRGGMPNEHQQQMRSPQARSPGRRPARPGSYHARQNGNTNLAVNGPPPTLQKCSSAMSFVPSSVRAKPQASTLKKAETDSATLEQHLKRMLNVQNGDTNGVR